MKSNNKLSKIKNIIHRFWSRALVILMVLAGLVVLLAVRNIPLPLILIYLLLSSDVAYLGCKALSILYEGVKTDEV